MFAEESCFMRKENPLGYTERECLENGEKGECLNQLNNVCIQARTTRKNGWLSELELEAIKRQIEAESQGELYKERDVRVEAETVETEVRKVEEKMNGAEASMILWKI